MTGPRVAAAVLAGLAFAAWGGTASAATITVTTSTDELTAGDGQCSLREAIATANGSGNGDCGAAAAAGPNMILLGARIYPLTLAAPHIGLVGACVAGYSQPDDGTQGELVITAQNLTIAGAGAAQTVLDACRLGDRALEVKGGASVTLRGLTITNGHAAPGTAGAAGQLNGSAGSAGNRGEGGGGILNEGTLTVMSSAVTANRAGDGGAGGRGGDGGGNGGSGGDGGDGGGIENAVGGTLTVSNATVGGDAAGDGGAGGAGTVGNAGLPGGLADGGAGGSGGNGGIGGGIWNDGGTVTVMGTTIASNSTGSGAVGAAGQNADITNGGNGGNGGTGGSAGVGGGIATEGGSLQATNDTIEGNVDGNGAAGGAGGEAANLGFGGTGGDGGDGGAGGGVWSKLTSALLANVTFARNMTGTAGLGGTAPDTHGNNGTAGIGGGLYVTNGSPTTTLRDTLLDDNQPGGDCRGNIADGGHNLVYSPPSVGSMPPPDLCVFNQVVSADPLLQPLADNGGPTQTMRLQPASPAIGAAAGCPALDQRGVVRPAGAGCDIGAYEAEAPAARTAAASAIGRTSATLHGTVIANQAVASYYFLLGASTKTSVQHAAGVRQVTALARITGLKPGTTYRYRLIATSIDGTTTGPQRTFTTRPLPPVISQLKVRRLAVTYRDSAAAVTTFVLSRCTRRGCHRVRKFTHRDRPGRNRLRLDALPPGRYRLSATPRLTGATGRQVGVGFTVGL